jgi:hypothetical protein
MTVSQLEYRFNLHIAIAISGFGLAIFGSMFEIKILTLLAVIGINSTLRSIRFAVQLAIASQQK